MRSDEGDLGGHARTVATAGAPRVTRPCPDPTEHPPYCGPSDAARKGKHEIAARVLAAPPTPLAAVASGTEPELAAICERAMARRPGDRYANMSAFAADLRAFLEHRVAAAYEVGPWAELKEWLVRNRGLAATAGASLELSAALTRGAIVRIRGERDIARARSSEILVALAPQEASHGRWAQAHQRFEAALALGYPDAAGVRMAQIEAWEAAGELKRARTAIEELARLDPREFGPHGAKLLLLRADRTREWAQKFDQDDDLVRQALDDGRRLAEEVLAHLPDHAAAREVLDLLETMARRRAGAR